MCVSVAILARAESKGTGATAGVASKRKREASKDDVAARACLLDFATFMKNCGPYVQESTNKAAQACLDWLDKNPLADSEQIWDKYDELEAEIWDSDNLGELYDELEDEFSRREIDAKNTLESEHYEAGEDKATSSGACVSVGGRAKIDDTDDLMQVEIERMAKKSLEEFNRTKIEAKNSLEPEHYEADED